MVRTVQLSSLPSILLGPMLRRVDPESVSVFFALRVPNKVTIRVYTTDSAGGLVLAQSGTRATAELAEHLHVVTVTATGSSLAPGTVFFYQAYFGPFSSDDNEVPEDAETLFSPGVYVAETDPTLAKNSAEAALLYPTTSSSVQRLPSFATPPDDLNNLRIFHASCRKPHGGGFDMLGQVDRIIGPAVTDANLRPHQLLLTGDQIYADDVADPLLAVIMANIELLGFIDEPMPNKSATMAILRDLLQPGRRQKVMENEAGFTSTEAKSHLMSFAEYCVMYLMVWSDVLWPVELPDFAEVYPDEADRIKNARWFESVGAEERLRSTYREEAVAIRAFTRELAVLRRAMAHVPVLMICDDHDVTDDWNLALEWVQNAVLPAGSKLGRRVVTDAMLAYAYFQAWGNTPGQFAPTGDLGKAGRDLIARTGQWDRKFDSDNYRVLGDLLALPSGITTSTVQGLATKTLTRPAGALSYHYAITWSSYQLVVLDTRTRRSYLGGPKDPPSLLWTDDALDVMLGTPSPIGPNAATVIVSPAVALGLPLLEEDIQPPYAAMAGIYVADVESWSASTAAYHKFLTRCLASGVTDTGGTRRRNVVLLSGDVHFGFAASAHYRAAKPYGAGEAPISGTIAQLVSSSLHNQDWKTEGLHAAGYDPLPRIVPHRTFAGWSNPDKSQLVIGKYLVRDPQFPQWITWVVHDSPAVVNADDGYLDVEPEWRLNIQYLKQDVADPVVVPRPGGPSPVGDPNAARDHALAQYIAASDERQKYLDSWGSGKEVVGLDNFGEITFEWPTGTAAADRRRVVQTLWWRMPGDPKPDGAPRDAAPLTRYSAPLDAISPTLAASSNSSRLASTATVPPIALPYGGFILRDGDRDGVTPTYDGAPRPGAANGSIAALQADLLELGFGLVGTADGDFARWTRWAVREFQTHARGGYVARDTQPSPRKARYSENLEQAPLPVLDRYNGSVSGVVDYATAAAIQTWKTNDWRCPVIVEAWNMSGGQPTTLYQIPASGGRPARNADNIWRYDEVQSTGPRMFAVDLSGRYSSTAAHVYDVPARHELTVLGQWSSWTDPRGVNWDGPVSLAPRHTWAEAEMLPERLLPVPTGGGNGPSIRDLVATRDATTTSPAQRDFAAQQLSTYKVVRAVSEVEAQGYFDVYNSYDPAFLSCGPCHWTVGPTVQPTTARPGPTNPQDRAVDEGELWAFFAYLQSVDPQAYDQMTADYGLGVDEVWGTDGTTLWAAGQRKYTAAATLTDEYGAAGDMPRFVREFNMFRNWHWPYRIAMAGRATNYDGWRRAMWVMARQRINDIVRTPWNVAGAFQVADVPTLGGGARSARIGDLFTSERAVGMLLRWHVNAPGRVVSRGRSGSSVRAGLNNARQSASGLNWAGAPDTWTDDHEDALIDGLSTESARIGGILDDTTVAVRDWPTWPANGNPYRFMLPVTDLPAAERNLLHTRNSFRFDDSALAHVI